ncbi:chemotaxis protein CheB [Paractinoplanes atraurantiacus]|uniref:protein-glutamate methylesterase n=1 Tax=Paractinoplanes atraurantiacus TaxID=1036182 RepID=A0A285I158_9ACTN|nr:chemotaxis protein CheB [Actinoplanes atraurantiacus]SNY41688.1 two-component system, chemotaxis family, response regulator CheB [Actinoplanes atraurantiacus]
MTQHRDVVAVGASAGGVEALRSVVGGLSPDYPGALLVVLHIARSAPSALPAILDRSGPLPASAAADGEPLRPGHVYVAPSDHHLLLLDGHLRLTRGPAENGHRPAIDPLFRSVARAAGPRAAGVVLSGSRDDGASGLAAIAAQGGSTIVQDPDDALCPWMPRAAIARMTPDHVLPVAKIGALLSGMADMDLPQSHPHRDRMLDFEVAIADPESTVTTDQVAEPAGYGCPSCGGSLFQIESDPVPRFRCRVGHAWSPESLLDEQTIALEGALWVALRALEEKSALSRRMAGSWHSGTGKRLETVAEDTETAAATIRKLIERLGEPGTPA